MTSASPGLAGFAALLPDHAESAEEVLPPAANRDDEHRAGRRCAGRAIQALGLPLQPVGQGPDGDPLWPRGFIGSITHGAGICAAALARRDGQLAGLGIDAARNIPLRPRVARRVLHGSGWPDAGRSTAGVHWDSVVFSAKEAVFKAWFPLTRSSLRFSDARLDVRRDGTIGIELTPTWGSTDDPGRWSGRYLVDGGVIRTAVVVEGG